MNISVCTPSIREPELELVRKSLLEQTYPSQYFEWIVCSPFYYPYANIGITDRPLNQGDFWGYNKSLNDCLKYAVEESKSHLIVVCNDAQWVKPHVLQLLWNRYIIDPKACVAGLGNHYEKVVDGIGQQETWHDVRWNRYKEYKEATEIDFDTALCSIPRHAILDAGYINEIFDTVACFGERELQVRIRNKGYTLNIDPAVEFIAQEHTKEYDPQNQWGQKFLEGQALYNQFVKL